MTGLLVALDFRSVDTAVTMAKSLSPHVSGFKVGLQLMLGPDPHPLERVVELGMPVFADVKLHDIPATVEKAAFQMGVRGARWITVHASGGDTMLEAAVAGFDEGSAGGGGVLAVTVLTSLDSLDLGDIGFQFDPPEQVRRLASLAAGTGVEGVVCAVAEGEIVKSVKPDLTVVTPGIRLAGEATNDQKRAATPTDAVEAGASFVVVGRPITRASDPASVASAIMDELSAQPRSAHRLARG